ncbi:MAG: hypothetical protein R3F59_20420 [Myxococcota bacterium]
MSGWMRQLHRWLSLAFTGMVVANLGGMALGVPESVGMAIGGATLLPLLPLLATGLYLFALPYLAQRRPG